MRQAAVNDYERIEKAIRFLEKNAGRKPELQEIAQSVNLSEYHFQRLFKRWAGVTPKQFLQALILERAKRALKRNDSLLDATYDAALSSPGRLHDLFVTIEAMTPDEYRKQGADLVILYGFHPSPFGECLARSRQGASVRWPLCSSESGTALFAISEGSGSARR
jgi:AraC family transcriptional regulator of adaptative response/methylated-DNA-[protein]-cysteine methyltransferase